MGLLIWIVLLFMAMVFHEVAHGVVAAWLGDPTARDRGRLSLNPLKHIDPFWTVLFPALLFISSHGHFMIGMAKPVPVNYARLQSPKRDMIWVALAGPVTNFLLAGIFAFLWKVTGQPFFLLGVYLNLGLGLFNLVPIPPLDGSRVLAGILPYPWVRHYLWLEPYGFLIVFLLYVSGILFRLLMPALDFACRLLEVPGLGGSF